MNSLIYMGIGSAIFLIIVVVILYYAFKGGDSQVHKIKRTSKANGKSAPSLKDLIDLAKEARSAKQIGKVIMAFLQGEVLPAKTTASLSEDAKEKLNFISAVCANKAADAKTIAFMIEELSHKYPEYTQEIEMYQNFGLAKRKMRR